MNWLPILVGEQNQISSDRRYDLYPYPENSAGGRLCSKVLGMKRTDYVRNFIRKNLLGIGEWDAKAAARTAHLILLGIEVEKRREPARLVLLGAKVCAAFGVPDVRDFETDRFEVRGVTTAHILRLPHPSGRCRVWNDPAAYERARAALREFLPPRIAALVGSADRD